MDERQKAGLIEIAGGGIRFGCPLAPYTTFGVGGPAEVLYEAQNIRGLKGVIRYLFRENIPYVVIGRGSNVLVRDEGISGLVILLCGAFRALEMETEGGPNILAGGGVFIGNLLSFCKENGLSGLEFLAGIPGTVGGAISMNAGAFGGEIGSRVIRVEAVTAEGELKVLERSQLRFSYRNLEMEQRWIITRGWFQMVQETASVVSGRIKDFLKRRKEAQPVDYPSAGSVFKNPPGDYAGRLIETAGLKGKCIGGAMISDKHANYIVNRGGARAADILALMDLIRKKVREEHGIELQPEIRVVGE